MAVLALPLALALALAGCRCGFSRSRSRWTIVALLALSTTVTSLELAPLPLAFDSSDRPHSKGVVRDKTLLQLDGENPAPAPTPTATTAPALPPTPTEAGDDNGEDSGSSDSLQTAGILLALGAAVVLCGAVVFWRRHGVHLMNDDAEDADSEDEDASVVIDDGIGLLDEADEKVFELQPINPAVAMARRRERFENRQRRLKHGSSFGLFPEDALPNAPSYVSDDIAPRRSYMEEFKKKEPPIMEHKEHVHPWHGRVGVAYETVPCAPSVVAADADARSHVSSMSGSRETGETGTGTAGEEALPMSFATTTTSTLTRRSFSTRRSLSTRRDSLEGVASLMQHRDPAKIKRRHSIGGGGGGGDAMSMASLDSPSYIEEAESDITWDMASSEDHTARKPERRRQPPPEKLKGWIPLSETDWPRDVGAYDDEDDDSDLWFSDSDSDLSDDASVVMKSDPDADGESDSEYERLVDERGVKTGGGERGAKTGGGERVKRERSVGRPKSPHVCPMCNKELTGVRKLNAHMREVHDTIRSFPCEVCGKPFPRRYNMLVHQRVHKKERPYQCDLCPASFTQKSNLKRHVCTKHEKPWKCPVKGCKGRFKSEEDAQQHIDQKHPRLEKPHKPRKPRKKTEMTSRCACNQVFKNDEAFSAHQEKCAIAMGRGGNAAAAAAGASQMQSPRTSSASSERSGRASKSRSQARRTQSSSSSTQVLSRGAPSAMSIPADAPPPYSESVVSMPTTSSALDADVARMLNGMQQQPPPAAAPVGNADLVIKMDADAMVDDDLPPPPASTYGGHFSSHSHSQGLPVSLQPEGMPHAPYPQEGVHSSAASSASQSSHRQVSSSPSSMRLPAFSNLQRASPADPSYDPFSDAADTSGFNTASTLGPMISTTTTAISSSSSSGSTNFSTPFVTLSPMISTPPAAGGPPSSDPNSATTRDFVEKCLKLSSQYPQDVTAETVSALIMQIAKQTGEVTDETLERHSRSASPLPAAAAAAPAATQTSSMYSTVPPPVSQSVANALRSLERASSEGRSSPAPPAPLVATPEPELASAPLSAAHGAPSQTHPHHTPFSHSAAGPVHISALNIAQAARLHPRSPDTLPPINASISSPVPQNSGPSTSTSSTSRHTSVESAYTTPTSTDPRRDTARSMSSQRSRSLASSLRASRSPGRESMSDEPDFQPPPPPTQVQSPSISGSFYEMHRQFGEGSRPPAPRPQPAAMTDSVIPVQYRSVAPGARAVIDSSNSTAPLPNLFSPPSLETLGKEVLPPKHLSLQPTLTLPPFQASPLAPSPFQASPPAPSPSPAVHVKPVAALPSESFATELAATGGAASSSAVEATSAASVSCDVHLSPSASMSSLPIPPMLSDNLPLISFGGAHDDDVDTMMLEDNPPSFPPPPTTSSSPRTPIKDENTPPEGHPPLPPEVPSDGDGNGSGTGSGGNLKSLSELMRRMSNSATSPFRRKSMSNVSNLSADFALPIKSEAAEFAAPPSIPSAGLLHRGSLSGGSCGGSGGSVRGLDISRRNSCSMSDGSCRSGHRSRAISISTASEKSHKSDSLFFAGSGSHVGSPFCESGDDNVDFLPSMADDNVMSSTQIPAT